MALQPDPLVRKTYGLRTSLLQRVEDYRFTRRIKTEAEAIRRVLNHGLKAIEATDADARQR
jgi:hypothetical protein